MFFLSALDWIIPEHMSGRISTFKDAVNQVLFHLSYIILGSLNLFITRQITIQIITFIFLDHSP